MRNLLADLNIPHQLDAPLAPLTWYGVGGPAAVLAHPSSLQQLGALCARCQDASVPTYILGSGANLLVADAGVEGVVVQLDDPNFRQLTIDGNLVTVGAGYDLAKLVLETSKQGLAGLQCLAGIPASLGGAVRMNAGGAFGEIGRCVKRLQVIDAAGQIYYRDRDDLLFSYRGSNIVAKAILQIELDLTPDDPDDLMRQVKEIFLYKKTTQPLSGHSAGCAFKNPLAPADNLPPALSKLPPPRDGRYSAGMLIDRAGLKGYRIGGAEISEQHANFVVTHPDAAAADVLAVIRHAQAIVHDRFGIALETEVVLWP
ncbi:MAG: UDP-N-acetylmuramate dehydrogenase [Phycisphaeraceae bacterium]|nr:UDP-N-acetylmuramate dehydrogenase [Phycisphaeraceae bacterium]